MLFFFQCLIPLRVVFYKEFINKRNKTFLCLLKGEIARYFLLRFFFQYLFVLFQTMNLDESINKKENHASSIGYETVSNTSRIL